MRLQSDERLAELAIDGHEAAFAAIVDRYRAPLLRYCAGIVGPSRAEDAVQQTLINAHDALKRTADVRHLRSWLYRIAHNAALNVLRAVRDDVPLDPAQAALAADGPDASFERAERLSATLAAVRDLPERQRAALVLRELEGRSHEEIADALGVTKGSARQHLMRARTAVRGAVTAFTPYPLVVKLAEALAGPAASSWTDAAAGVGAGATMAKLTAGIVATGALVGGAVGTERVVVRHNPPAATAAHEKTTRTARTARTPARAAVVVGTPAALTSATTVTSGARGKGGRHNGGSGGQGSNGSGSRSGSGPAGVGGGRDDRSGSRADDTSSKDQARRGKLESGSGQQAQSDRQGSGSEDQVSSGSSSGDSGSGSGRRQEPPSRDEGGSLSPASGKPEGGSSGRGSSSDNGGDATATQPPATTTPAPATRTDEGSVPDPTGSSLSSSGSGSVKPPEHD